MNGVSFNSKSVLGDKLAIEQLDESKQDKLTFDSTPTSGSNNPVTSDGIKAAVDTKMPVNPQSIELFAPSGATNGGYIDFHYGGSSADYTSRIIEDSSGQINIKASRIKLESAPTHPTPTATTNDTTSATTAFVHSLLTYGTTDLTPGTSDLETGVFYAYYT